VVEDFSDVGDEALGLVGGCCVRSRAASVAASVEEHALMVVFERTRLAAEVAAATPEAVSEHDWGAATMAFDVERHLGILGTGAGTPHVVG
jgi:phosphoglycerate dehydrogenase-like enzyme